MKADCRIIAALGIAVAVLPLSAPAQTIGSYNLYGNTGLIDMPTAGNQPDGETAWTMDFQTSQRRGTMAFQFLRNLEFSVRYSAIQGIGPGGSTSNDMSFDLKYTFVDEHGYWPSIAIGARDFMGDGVYSAEFIVATKTVMPGLQVTGGIGWGRLGSYGGFPNPFGLDYRPTQREAGGQLGFNQMFRGDAAFFGGVEWQTPIDNLTLKAEYSSDAYVQEVAAGTYVHDSPFNFGIEYRPWNSFKLGAYYMNGADYAVMVTFSGNPNRPITRQDAGIGPIPVAARAPTGNRSGDWASSEEARNTIMQAVSEALREDGIGIESASLKPKVVEIRISSYQYVSYAKAVGRTARVMAMTMPWSVETFRITVVQRGMPISTIEIDRSEYERQIDRPDAGIESWQSVVITDAAPELEGNRIWERPTDYPNFGWSLRPSVPIEFSYDGAAVTFQVLAVLSGNWDLGPGLSVTGVVSQFLFGNIDVNAAGNQYDRTNRPVIPRLTIDKFFKLSQNVYARASAGYFEKQWGGVSGEILWKPIDQNWGLGLEVDYLMEREKDTYLNFNGDNLFSSFVSAYWDTGYHDITTQLDVGRYTAGDVGATFSVGRRFNNGWEVQAYVTKTNVSFSEYGEAAFDKGVRFSVPLRWTLPFESKSRATVDLNSGYSPYGQRVNISNRLWPELRDYSNLRMYETWGAFWQ